MTKIEWNNLAKNQYCDEDIQVWIAKHAHLQARYYLAERPDICTEAMNAILDGKSLLAKWSMVGTGALRDYAVIRELYFAGASTTTAHGRYGGFWRVQNSFVMNYWACHDKSAPTNTPPDVLEDIWHSYFDFEDNTAQPRIHRHSEGSYRHLANHPNCSLKLAIMMSTSSVLAAAKYGKLALVRLSSKKSPSS